MTTSWFLCDFHHDSIMMLKMAGNFTRWKYGIFKRNITLVLFLDEHGCFVWLRVEVESGETSVRKSHYFTPHVCVIFPAKLGSLLIFLLAQNLWDKPLVIPLKLNFNHANIMVISDDNDPDVVSNGHTK
jgi:hypothetical protein